jgi:hypothetical protein
MDHTNNFLIHQQGRNVLYKVNFIPTVKITNLYKYCNHSIYAATGC